MSISRRCRNCHRREGAARALWCAQSCRAEYDIVCIGSSMWPTHNGAGFALFLASEVTRLHVQASVECGDLALLSLLTERCWREVFRTSLPSRPSSDFSVAFSKCLRDVSLSLSHKPFPYASWSWSWIVDARLGGGGGAQGGRATHQDGHWTIFCERYMSTPLWAWWGELDGFVPCKAVHYRLVVHGKGVVLCIHLWSVLCYLVAATDRTDTVCDSHPQECTPRTTHRAVQRAS